MDLFSSLTLKGWRQIGEIDLTFHPRLTVITGANGAGKTTLLSLLARHFGWQAAYLSTPRYQAGGGLEYWSDLWESYYPAATAQHSIGKIKYNTGHEASLVLPKKVDSAYHITIQGARGISGLHIPSHRPFSAYQPLQKIPTSPPQKQQISQRYFSLYQQKYQNQYVQESTNLLLKESIVALGIFGFGNEVLQANNEARELFAGFQKILKQVMPPKLGFESIAIRTPEVILVTKSGEFVLDAVSGGISSIIDTAWQIFMYAPENAPFVVTIDEPENHLHPELQRTLLGSLMNAFPLAQFIVASHNPFIVTSVSDSAVYVLDFDAKDNKVRSKLLDAVEKSGTANEILRDVLGLPVAMPLWVQNELETLVAKYASVDLTPETFQNLRTELARIGLAKYAPETIANVVDRRS